MAKAKAKKKRRLVQGRDYHGWAWKPGKDDQDLGNLLYWAEPNKPSPEKRPCDTGKWVRVKFIEVEA